MITNEKELYFGRAYINSKWENGVRIKVSDQGLITKVELNSDRVKTDEIYGTGIPGIPNIHSHSFQRIMAGLSEYKLSQGDDFWTWRELMYRYANQISPANLAAIATQLYIEMVKSGYTGVAEFHYIHRKKGGLHYDNPATLSESIIEAAKTAGINLTLLPVSYMYSGFGQEPLSSEQRRFGNDVENYLELLQLVSKSTSIYQNANLGMAFHSLRALSPEAMNEILSEFNRSWPHSPIHIHIAEQTKEVNDCLAWCGKRPVEWLLQNHEVDDRWCLVHATHLTSPEINSLAKSGAIAGLCPTTEANLGDGFFPLRQFLDAGGHIAIGSDSNSSVSPVEEMRWLEYGQRLVTRSRNVVSSEGVLHTGSSLFDNCTIGGAKALGQKTGVIKEGYQADILVLDDNAANFASTPSEFALDTFIFNGNRNLISDVMVSGQWQVKNYKHVNEEYAEEQFKKTLSLIRRGS